MKKKSVLIISLIIFAFFVSGCKVEKTYISNIDAVNKLFILNNTDASDLSKLNEILDLSNCTEYKVESIELKNDKEPLRLIVNFSVDSRANHRYIDENGLNKMSALMLSLIPDLDEVLYAFYDNYAKRGNPENAFYCAYYTKNNLCERIASDKITVDYIKKSAGSVISFEEYYKTVMATDVKASDRAFLNKVYEFIGNDCEIAANSSIGADIELDKYSASDFSVISDNLIHSIGKYQGAGINAHIVLYDIRNFKTNEIKKCVFLYYIHPDEGVIVIESDYVDKKRYNEILKLIMKLQTEPITKK